MEKAESLMDAKKIGVIGELIYKIGVPSVVCLFLVWFLSFTVAHRLDKTNDILLELSASMREMKQTLDRIEYKNGLYGAGK